MLSTRKGAKSKQISTAKSSYAGPPGPFKTPPEVLKPFINKLDKQHVYITHIDAKPATFKRQIFMVPVAMNVATALLFIWRMYAIVPWYLDLLRTSFGTPEPETFRGADATWSELLWVIATRAAIFLIDFSLFVFVWPWPVEFTLGRAHGNPTKWRWNVGFRDREIYVRRSRDWDTVLGDFLNDSDSKAIFTTYVKKATSPLLQEQKTGYLLMDAQWDLDWNGMILAHSLVDKKDIAQSAFRNVVLAHHVDFGWLSYDLNLSVAVDEDIRRRHVFAFRDALAGLGKEELFYKWVEIVQLEATQKGGLGPEKQEAAAKKIREMFEAENINFDELWKDTVGTSNTLGM